MITNFLPVETTHSSLDLFEKPPLLVTFDGSFEQRIGPSYSTKGQSIEFEVVGDRNNFIDLQKIYLQVTCQLIATKELTADEKPKFVNNLLHSLFSECTVYVNTTKVSATNGLYAHKSFIETEYSHGIEAKNTWLACQGYEYEKDPSNIDSDTFTSRSVIAKAGPFTLIGKIAADLFGCEKHLLSGVTLRISLRRSQSEFVTVTDNNDQTYRIDITDANLFVRKMTVADNVVSAIEKVLTKTPAQYRYTEVISKSFLAGKGQFNWKHEDVFNKEPIRRFAVAMNTNKAFMGSKQTNPFNYQKFNLTEITVYRNGTPVAGTPLDTRDNKRIYFNSLSALSYVEHGHGIPLSEYSNHFVMIFDLTSTQQAAREYIYPELTNSSISVEFTFGTGLVDNIEIIFLGEKATTLYIDSARKVSKNVLMGA